MIVPIRAEARGACETLIGHKLLKGTMDSLSEAEAAVHPHRHILTRALGVGDDVAVDRRPVAAGLFARVARVGFGYAEHAGVDVYVREPVLTPPRLHFQQRRAKEQVAVLVAPAQCTGDIVPSLGVEFGTHTAHGEAYPQ